MSQPKVSISGIRGIVGESIDSRSVLDLAMAFGCYLNRGTVVVGRDSRNTGEMLKRASEAGLMAVGSDAINVGIVPTPTVGILVRELEAAGGIVITASHNPIQWNAMKFYGPKGIFLTASEFEAFYKIYESGDYAPCSHDQIGQLSHYGDSSRVHLDKILSNIDVDAIRTMEYRVVVDGCRGAGSALMPKLLRELGCEVIEMDCIPDGNFTRIAEPRPEHLTELSKSVEKHSADVGFALDPDADRLALVAETGVALSEELTLALVADHLLPKYPAKPFVANTSSSLVLDRIAEKHGVPSLRTKVGEINVTEKMEEVDSMVGGEGNGGVIWRAVHPGRDAATGAAIILEYMATSRKHLSELAAALPSYVMIKDTVPASGDFDAEKLHERASKEWPSVRIDELDGVKICFENSWALIRASNTEPIVRVVVEAPTEGEADVLMTQVKKLLP